MPDHITRSPNNKTFFRMPDGYGHYFARTSGRVYGTMELIHFLTLLSALWYQKEPTHPFGLGDLAESDGRGMDDHKSHFDGKAVDIFTIPKDPSPTQRRKDHKNIVTWADNLLYDQKRTEKLVRLIADLRDRGFPMIQFLYNDPKISVPGLTRKGGHDEHMHILLIGKRTYSDEQIEEKMRVRHVL